MERTIQSNDTTLRLCKSLKHDDFHEDKDHIVFVRGNGFWLDTEMWISAESVLSRFKTSGLKFTDGTDGQFQVAILDKHVDKFHFITDHLNFFPFYLNHDESGYVLSDSLTPFVHFNFDNTAIKQLFALSSIIGNRTLFKGVMKLAAASVTSLKSGELKEETYWQCRPIETDSDAFKKLLTKTISRVAKLSKKPSLTLTAGLDSRMIFSELISQKINFDTFTFGYNGATDCKTAKRISQDFGIDHTAYVTDPSNADFIENFEENFNTCLEFSDGMIPTLKGVPAYYCFSQEANDHDMIITATGELVYSHYAEVPTLLPKDNSSLESIIKFLVHFNADLSNPDIKKSASNLETEMLQYFEQFHFDRKMHYYDAFYLQKLSGLTSYYQQYLSSSVRIYNPIFTKEMINSSMGLSQSLRDHRKLQRDIIAENDRRLNQYLVNGFKVVKPGAMNFVRAKINYAFRLGSKLINRLLGQEIFKMSYIYFPPIIQKSGIRNSTEDLHTSIKWLKKPTKTSSETYLLNFLSFVEWMKSNSKKSA